MFAKWMGTWWQIFYVGQTKDASDRFPHDRWAEAVAGVAARDRGLLVVRGRRVGVAVRPGPVLAGRQSDEPSRRERDGIADADPLLMDQARPVDPR